ncbi:MAG: hypothetical protein ACJAVY_000508 [Marinoscillum sp.]|jgi:hypothetical protein
MKSTLKTFSKISYLSFIVITLSVLSCGEKKQSWDSFGDPISSDLIQEEALDNLNDTPQPVKFEAEIAEVCQMKGCWMTLKGETGQSVRVTFKDYGFFVPKDASGRKVIIEGVASVAELDEATAKHYAEDAGVEYDESKTLREVSVVASGVLIAKSDQL